MTDHRRFDAAPPWDESRGPRLPDAITRVPVLAWPFLLVATWAVSMCWDTLRAVAYPTPIDLTTAIIAAVPSIVAPLIGAALFFRHPDAHRSVPLLAAGAGLLALTTVFDHLRPLVHHVMVGSEPDAFGLPWPLSLPMVGYWALTVFAFVLALTFLAIGLVRERRFEDGSGGQWAAVALTLVAVAIPGVTALVSTPWIAGQEWLSLVSLGALAATNLAWAYLAWTAIRGRRAGEEPGTAWACVAVTGVGTIVVGAAQALLLVAQASSPAGPVPFLFEAGRLIGVAVAGLWLCLLAAFALGVPTLAPAISPSAATDDLR
jgi:hypothetical protein